MVLDNSGVLVIDLLSDDDEVEAFSTRRGAKGGKKPDAVAATLVADKPQPSQEEIEEATGGGIQEQNRGKKEDAAVIDPFGPLARGEQTFVRGSGSRVYTIKRTGNTYYCTCPSWKFQKNPASSRTCKHIKSLRSGYSANNFLSSETVGGEIATARKRPVPANRSGTENGLNGPKAKKSRKDTIDRSAAERIEVTLAKPWEGQDPTGWYLSEKLDGMRCVWDGRGGLRTRNGNAVDAPESFTAALPRGIALDGELFLGRGRFQECMSVVRRRGGTEEDWDGVALVVFDAPDADGDFPARLVAARHALEACSCPERVARVLPQELCRGRDHTTEELERIVRLGGEGIMLRNPTAAYRGGRSSDLLKVKRFLDAEAIVTGHEPGRGRHLGRLGALLCQMIPSGRTFKIGTGFTDAQREAPPPVGTTVTYRYQEETKSGVPRFPTFDRVRPAE